MINLDKIAEHPLQTNAWADFRYEWGNEVLKTEYGLITLHKIPFLPYKIGVFEKGPAPTKEMLQNLKKIGLEKKIIFIKLEPNTLKTEALTKLLTSEGAVTGKTLFTPTTFWLDITLKEDDLLKSFSSKTRYNIRLAERHGVSVKEDNSPKAFERYLELTQETAGRQGFYAHSSKYHRLMWKHLHTNFIKKGEKPIARLLTATYKNQIITTWILFSWGTFLYYPYGASTDQFKNVMANNLMLWEAIKLGKKIGLETFDLWGREDGRGFTKFKEGYNPQVIEFQGSWDLVLNKPLYYLYRAAEFIRWKSLKLLARLGLSKQRLA